MSKEWPDIPALLAEAREWGGSYASWGDNGLVDRLVDALEAATREPDASTQLAQSLAMATTLTGSDATAIAKAALELGGTIRNETTAAVGRVRAIHAPGKIIDVWGKSRSQGDDFLVCVECTDPDNWWIAHPCATIQALYGVPEPEWEYGLQDDDGYVSFKNLSLKSLRKRAKQTGEVIVRRGPASKWLPVEGENDE